MATPITIIRGDGIGPEVIDAAVLVLRSSGVQLELEPAEAGAVANIKMGDALPDETLRSIRRTRLCLKGPLESPVASTRQGANARLRDELGLYADVRPVQSHSGVTTPFRHVDLALVREIAEGENAAVERYLDQDGDVAQWVSTTTRAAAQRVVKHAFDYAVRTNRHLITLVHNADVLQLASGLFLQAGRVTSKEYSRVRLEEMSVDSATTQMVINPSRFEVIVTMSGLGGALSNLAAGLVGGLGLAPGMAVGADVAVFGPVHGTALDIAGKGIANPTAAILAGAMMLRHIGETDAARQIESAVRLVIGERRHVTPDLGGRATTTEFGEHVAEVVRTP
jgi:isocitrate dehydrogenase (NAD+)